MSPSKSLNRIISKKQKRLEIAGGSKLESSMKQNGQLFKSKFFPTTDSGSPL